MFENFTPLMMILWIAAVGMIFSAIIVVTFSACITCYYNAKDTHRQRWIKAIGKALESINKAMEKKIEETEELKKSFSSKLDEFIKNYDRKDSGHE